MSHQDTQTTHLEPENNEALQRLCGYHNQHISLIEQYFSVQIKQRGFKFVILGNPPKIERALRVLHILYQIAQTQDLTTEQIQRTLLEQPPDHESQSKTSHPEDSTHSNDALTVTINKKSIRIESRNQQNYVKALQSINNIIIFALGPAGTGKTFLAVMMAIKMLKAGLYKRIILTRPAVEAGEQLGFLPGDLVEKILPYLQPLYDAMYRILGKQEITELIEQNVIEIAPLAFMRGRTLNDSIIILDEAQNTTDEQMKMFLTRIGCNSKVIVTGDNSQIDIPLKNSGLNVVIQILQNIQGIKFINFDIQDVHRHNIVKKIIQAYETVGANQMLKSFTSKTSSLPTSNESSTTDTKISNLNIMN